MPDDDRLLAALAIAERHGAIGERSLPAAIRHSELFLAAIPETARRLVDLGSGGGLPGLVIASRRADLAVTLIERRGARADLLRRLVARLDLGLRVAVADGDAELLGRSAPLRGSADVVTARSFGSPEVTARVAHPYLVDAGLLVVSAPPPGDDRWSAVPDWTIATGLSGVLVLRPNRTATNPAG